MAVEERDPHSGYLTTGHEWNGIKELNTPVPRVVYFFLIATALFALGYWILMPAWPLGSSFTPGLLGNNQREIVADSLQQAQDARAHWAATIETADLATVQADPALIGFVRQTGRTLFGDNCGACHGHDAKGGGAGRGFPNLTTASWLWGGSPEAIAETIRVGINSAHPDTRVSQMMAFGRDGVLQSEDIERVAHYVQSLSQPVDVPADKLAAGKTVFEANCVACHGDGGTGKTDVGAPNLTDATWLYGGDLESIYRSVWGGRQGHMPTWESRLSVLDRKILALYLVDLRAPAP